MNSKFSPALKKACVAKSCAGILKHGSKQFGPLKVMALTYDNESGRKGKIYGISVPLNHTFSAMLMAWIWRFFDFESGKQVTQVVNAFQLSNIQLYEAEPSFKYMIKCLRLSMHIEEDSIA